MSERPLRVRFEGVTKRFGGTLALDGVTFGVRAGCVHALLGENGAGKSTLMRALAGVLRPDGGTMHLDEQQFAPGSAREAQRAGVAIVHQELSIVPHLSVAENVFLGRWPRRRGGMVDVRTLRSASQELFDRLGIEASLGAPAGSLSVAQQQMVEIARALSMEARVLALDEPTAALSPREADALFGFVRSLAARGVSVIYISHRMDEVFAVAEWATVLRDGRHVLTSPMADATRDGLIRAMVGRAVSAPRVAARARGGAAVLRVDGLTSRGRFEDVSLEVAAGEVFGLMGLVGSGRSSLAKSIFGAARVDAGRMSVTGRKGPFQSVRAARRAGVAFVPEDRKREGLLSGRSVRENLTLAEMRRLSRAGVVVARKEREMAMRLMSEQGIRAAGPEAPIGSLSGGNQQKALIARWLARRHPLIILDEPTRGVDVGAKADIHESIGRIAAAGGAVVVISAEPGELIALCDRIGVMRRGRLVATLENEARNVSQERLMALATGASEAAAA